MCLWQIEEVISLEFSYFSHVTVLDISFAESFFPIQSSSAVSESGNDNVFSIIPFYLCLPFCVNNLFFSKQKIPNSSARETEENHGNMALLNRWLDYPIFHQISRIFRLYHQLRFPECRNSHRIKVIQWLL